MQDDGWTPGGQQEGDGIVVDYFKLRAGDGGTYVLRQQRGVGDGGAWSLESHYGGPE